MQEVNRSRNLHTYLNFIPTIQLIRLYDMFKCAILAKFSNNAIFFTISVGVGANHCKQIGMVAEFRTGVKIILAREGIHVEELFNRDWR